MESCSTPHMICACVYVCVMWSCMDVRVGRNSMTSLSLFTFMHWRSKWQPTPVFLPGESQGRGSLVACCPWGHTESDTTEATQQQQQQTCPTASGPVNMALSQPKNLGPSLLASLRLCLRTTSSEKLLPNPTPRSAQISSALSSASTAVMAHFLLWHPH